MWSSAGVTPLKLVFICGLWLDDNDTNAILIDVHSPSIPTIPSGVGAAPASCQPHQPWKLHPATFLESGLHHTQDTGCMSVCIFFFWLNKGLFDHGLGYHPQKQDMLCPTCWLWGPPGRRKWGHGRCSYLRGWWTTDDMPAYTCTQSEGSENQRARFFKTKINQRALLFEKRTIRASPRDSLYLL